MSQPWTHTAGATAYARVDEHYVEPHSSDEPRIVIAFNANRGTA